MVLPAVIDSGPEMAEVAPDGFPDDDVVAFPTIPLDTADFWRLGAVEWLCEVGLLVFCSVSVVSVFCCL